MIETRIGTEEDYAAAVEAALGWAQERRTRAQRVTWVAYEGDVTPDPFFGPSGCYALDCSEPATVREYREQLEYHGDWSGPTVRKVNVCEAHRATIYPYIALGPIPADPDTGLRPERSPVAAGVGIDCGHFPRWQG